ncbi:MAG: hypothetical protein NZM04_00205 [Methylacidiphilales bacterium]|nr:hypothetical protein [Candidatus Methylacidiphilales bacterium]
MNKIKNDVRSLKRDDTLIFFTDSHYINKKIEGWIKKNLSNIELDVFVGTISEYARRLVYLYFPTLAHQSGFIDRWLEPVFISVEMSQYIVKNIIEKEYDDREFSPINTPDFSLQVLDCMNKCADSHIDISEINQRLLSAWGSKSIYVHLFKEVQEIAYKFRRFCLDNNVLDYSLTMEVFYKNILKNEPLIALLLRPVKIIAADRVENAPGLLSEFIVEAEKYVENIYIGSDIYGMTRRYLFNNKYAIENLNKKLPLQEIYRYENESDISTFTEDVVKYLKTPTARPSPITYKDVHFIKIEGSPNTITSKIAQLIELETDKNKKQKVCILSPSINDMLINNLSLKLNKQNITHEIIRPSRPLISSPLIRSLLVLSNLVYESQPNNVDVSDLARALYNIFNIDVFTAQLISENITKNSFNDLILHNIDGSYIKIVEGLKQIMVRYKGQQEDISKFFSEIMALVDEFRTKNKVEAMEETKEAMMLISLAKQFERSKKKLDDNPHDIGRLYVDALKNGFLPSTMHTDLSPLDENNIPVCITPITTFLNYDSQANIQIWLNVSSHGWVSDIFKPFTHPEAFSFAYDHKVWDKNRWHIYYIDKLCENILALGTRCSHRLYIIDSRSTLWHNSEENAFTQALQRVIIPKSFDEVMDMFSDDKRFDYNYQSSR